MPTECLAIFGAGGHAKVALDALQLMQDGVPVEIWDDAEALAGRDFCGLAIHAPSRDLSRMPDRVHVAIGRNAARRAVAERLLGAGKKLLEIRHPAASVAITAVLGQGVLICAGAIIGPQARVGDGAIINHAAVVDHDCVVGAWVHIAPGAVLGGAVTLGSACLVGAGAVLLPGISVGDDAQIGAGAVVTRDVPAGATVAGVPARKLSRS